MNIQCEVSLGELVDKISILKIKMEKIKDTSKTDLVLSEYKALNKTLEELRLSGIENYLSKLQKINTELWEIEDDIRECEKRSDFSSQFISLARSVYITNDQRFAVKNEVNNKYGSSMKEVKSYEEY
ncbi:DUF6165 family protein [Halobacteriovorax sp. JY17]|uniref:DUF6165 family protein n=1 Tax=Halobacteriovorax sp. JY17 TaxID=2014617 RepID=UPI000C53A485|nr:DUF6165 family protein [Halobacteriovorax sp. JY17]PIK16441.1 MAG: hypothetical protein CES88_06790 [Halobacteriovorax sp. JY17]